MKKGSTMQLSDLLVTVIPNLTCRERTKAGYRHRVNFLIRYGSDITLTEFDEAFCQAVRNRAIEAGRSAVTIENSINNVASLLKRLGHPAKTGKPLRRLPPNPTVITIDHLNRAIPCMCDWLRCFCTLAYVTGLRRDDLRAIDLASIGDSLKIRASKTGKWQRFPIPQWARRTITVDRFPADTHTIYRNLRIACDAANVPYFTPQNIRVLSARTWEKVSHGLGPVILGHSLPGWSSATPYYLDPCDVLFDRIHDFPALDSLLTVKERCEKQARRERIIRIIDRLDAKKQVALLDVAEGLTG